MAVSQFFFDPFRHQDGTMSKSIPRAFQIFSLWGRIEMISGIVISPQSRVKFQEEMGCHKVSDAHNFILNLISPDTC